MIIQSAELKDFRNYRDLTVSFDQGTNVIYGDNAQGKTNLLEALYVASTSKSHKASKDKDMIRFGCDEAHIKLNIEKKGIESRIDIHIKKNRAKGIAVNGIPIKKASELLGLSSVVFFSPEDLSIIKNGPSERRRFADMELCQLNRLYLHDLIAYNRVIEQKNRLLKEMNEQKGFDEILDVYNEQLTEYGTKIILVRKDFIEKLNKIIKSIHSSLTKGKEEIEIVYEPDVLPECFSEMLEKNRHSEIRQRMSITGPHRDDICFLINGTDIRKYGSQGQQKTAALSLKLAEIRLVEETVHDRPVLLLDDVMSELDRKRQTMLLDNIENIQTVITCTGTDDLINSKINIDRLFYVENGTVTGEI